LASFKKSASKILHDDSFISIAGAVGAFCGGIRFQWGPLVDRFTFKKVYAAILILQIILGATFSNFAVFHKVTFMIYLCLLVFMEAGHFTLMPIMIAKLFGGKAQIVYPFAFSFSGIASLIISFLVHFLLDGNFELLYYISTALNLVSFAILLGLYQEKVLAI
jgi:MFS family permease